MSESDISPRDDSDPRPMVCPNGHPLWWFNKDYHGLYWALCDHAARRKCAGAWLWNASLPNGSTLALIREFNPETLIRVISGLRARLCQYEDRPWDSDHDSHFVSPKP